MPAMMSYWSELARDSSVPRKGTPTTLVRATRTDPPYVTDALDRRACASSSARDFTLVDFDCDHMVAQAKPAETAAVIRDRLDTPSHGRRSPTNRSRGCARSSPSIPAGRVSTYGDIASAAGLSSPRIVGWIMRTDSSDLPWHRVITASGRPAAHLTTRQLELLRAEGVLADDGRVPLREVRHEF